jgi:hypothetical protein
MAASEAPKADTKSDTKPEAKPGAKPDTKPDTKSEAKSEAKADSKADTKPDTKPDAYSNISLMLDEYDDIFSGFDPRPYSERAISVDFLSEAQRASVDKPTGQTMLVLLMPEKLRDLRVESVIKRRLRSHFDRHFKRLKKSRAGIIRGGFSFFLLGIVIMFLASFILYNYPSGDLLVSFLIILFEPAGWFLFWNGLEQILFESKKLLPELEFNKKMARADIIFQSY